jgi:hypothetical protein
MPGKEAKLTAESASCYEGETMERSMPHVEEAGAGLLAGLIGEELGDSSASVQGLHALGFEVGMAAAGAHEEPWRVVRLGLSRRAIDDQIEALVDLETPSLLPPLLFLPEEEQLPLAVQPLASLLPPPLRRPASLAEELFCALTV